MKILVIILSILAGGDSTDTTWKVVPPYQDGVSPPLQLEQPVKVTVPMAPGPERISGEITAWSYGAYWVRRDGGGDPERIGWDEIRPGWVYTTTRRLIERDDMVGYYRLGVQMLELDEPDRAKAAFAIIARQDKRHRIYIDRAFHMKENGMPPVLGVSSIFRVFGRDNELLERDDPSLIPYIKEKKPERSKEKDPASKKKRKSKKIELWEWLNPEERAAAVEEQRVYADSMVMELGDHLFRSHETEHFILVTDLNDREVERWEHHLEAANGLMSEMLSSAIMGYAGKCTVFLFKHRKDFISFEKRVMDYDASSIRGICHRREGNVYLSCYRLKDDAEFQSTLIHQSVHGYVYRMNSSERVPKWVSEGLAELISGKLTKASTRPREHWEAAKQFVERGNDPLTIMRQTVEDGSWPSTDSYAVSHMLMRHLLHRDRHRFRTLINGLKHGLDQDVAMQEYLQVDASTIAHSFVESIKSEKKFNRDH